jgi:hypothetical protein
MLVYFKSIWSIFLPFGIFCGHFVYFMVIWYIFPRFGLLYQEKSGNPGAGQEEEEEEEEEKELRVEKIVFVGGAFAPLF